MKKCVLFLLSLILLTVTDKLLAQGTAFTYQGQLLDTGRPANGLYDLQLLLFNSLSGNTQVGSTQKNVDVGVTNGLFTLTVDFGPVFTGSSNWLQVNVRTNSGGTFIPLNPRQPLTPTPYAIFAKTSTNFTGSLAGDVTGMQSATVVSMVGGLSAGSVATGASAAIAAASANMPGAIVKRDLNGNLAVGGITSSRVEVTGLIQPSVGSAFGNQGIEWPSNPAGGAGDLAWIHYFISTGQGGDNDPEKTTLQIGINNDPNDAMEFYQFGAPRLDIWNGCVGINKQTPAYPLDVLGTCAATSFVQTSDRNAKENFQAVSPRDILAKVAALPLSRWNYKTDKTQEHIGPMAQDFHAAFRIGADDKHIAVVDEGGVALAAIQGLDQKLNEKDAEIQQLKEKAAKVDSLEQRVNELQEMVRALSAKK